MENDIITRIRLTIKPGTKIPKPESAERYEVAGWTRSRGEEALSYIIPKKVTSKTQSTKRIPIRAFKEGWKVLKRDGQISRVWFKGAFPEADSDGGCNFTTLGGVFILLGEAEYFCQGQYKYLGLKSTA